MHVLVLAETLDAEGKVSKAFPTHESSHAASGLAEYLDAVPQGRTVSELKDSRAVLDYAFRTNESSFTCRGNVCYPVYHC